MSTDGGPAKRPPGPDLGPTCRAAKRRKQSTPVRIHDPGPNSADAVAPHLQDGGQENQQASLEDGSHGDSPSPSDEIHSRPELLLHTYNSRSNDGEENGHAYNENEGIRRGFDSDKRDLNEINDDEGNINSYAARSSEFLDKYKERLDEKLGTQAYVTSRFAGDNRGSAKSQLEDEHESNHVEKLNAYRVKGLENINAMGEGSSRRDSFNNEHSRDRERFEIYRPHSVGNKPQDDERISERYRSQSVNDQRQESPEDSENYRNKADDRQSCGRCGLMFPTLDQLRVHYETEHSERNGRTSHGGLECKIEPYEAEDGSPGGSVAPGPRMDVAWGVDFQAKMADLYKNALAFPHDGPKDSLPPNFNPLCPPFPLFPGSVPPQRPMMEPIRIFNPEAYCELCSKEFCNKYFLKTHKANKHGIYENNPSSSGSDNLTLENSFMPGAFASSAMKFKNNMMLADYAKSYEAALLASQRHKAKIQRMMEEARDMEKSNAESQVSGIMSVPIINSRQVQLEDVRSSSDDNTIPENFIFKGDVRHDQEEPFMTPTPRKLSPDSSKRARDSGFNADTLRRLGVINPEAFCKICCKEYCNKYFLKTHKIKRHGLLPSPTEKFSGKDSAQLITERFERKDGQTSPLNLIMGEENQEKQSQSPDASKGQSIGKDANVAHANHMRPLSTHSIDSMNAVEVKRDTLNNDESLKNDQSKQSPTTIFISEDLQKLQTMISQLNDLSVNKIVECYICKKEFDNNYVLQFHMMSDHGVSMPGSVEAFTFPSASGEDMLADGSQQQKTMCTVCEKDFVTIPLLKKHIEEFHTPKMVFGDGKNSADCLNIEKEANQQRERRASMSLTPTNSYCEICNKELCNKYFMKTHMQRMHGIEIENGTQIGGVICDICNKELCSKYFLRVHKHNTHGIVEPGAPLPQMRNLTGEPEPFNAPQVSSPLKPPPEASILNNRFIAHFIEVCPFCSRRFRTSKWLKAHLLSDHGKAGIDKWKELEVQYKAQAKAQAAKTNKTVGGALSIPDTANMSSNSPNIPLDLQERLPFYSKLVEPKLLNMFSLNNPDMKTYNCSYCPFSTSILSFLYVHEKSHVQGPEMDILCPMCPESFSKPEALQFHIITSHSLPEWRERVGPDSSPSSTREYQNRQSASKTPEPTEDIKEPIPAGNGKAEMFECYECDFKSCSFGEMEAHLRSQHFAVREGNIDLVTNNDGENNYGEDLSRKNKMPAIYAVPTNLDLEGSDNQHSSITMQPFVIEENTPEVSGGKFVPSLVFLPVRRRTTGVITISFNLTPA